MKTLWQWSARDDRWDWVTEALPEMQKRVLRAYRRRNPVGTQFRWRTAEQGVPKRYRRRTGK